HRIRQKRNAAGREISRSLQGETGPGCHQSVATGVADGKDCCGRAKSEAARRRSACARIWDERTAERAQAASLESFDAGRARAGFYHCNFRIDRRVAQAFQSWRGVARHRSRIRGRKTSLAVPAKIRAQGEVAVELG